MMIIVGWYNKHLKNPFSVYGENFFILAQNIAIVVLIWTYNKEIKVTTKTLISLSVLALFAILYNDSLVSNAMWKILINIQCVMLIVARTPQIWQNYVSKSTGQLAFITLVLNTIGWFIRVMTIIKETTDVFNYLAASLSLLFNAILTFQILYYWNSTNKEIEEFDDYWEISTIMSYSSDSEDLKKENLIFD